MMTSRCAACRYLRRKCPSDCIFSPYFPPNDPDRFSLVHRIYGASNVGKMLQLLPANLRGQAADSLYLEAKCRIEDPVYGCAGIISRLFQQVHIAESQLVKIQAEIAVLRSQTNELNHRHQLETREAEVDLDSFFSEQSNFVHFSPPPLG